MSVRKSSARQIEDLLADLSHKRPVVRESAIARLAVAGPRAVSALTKLVADLTAPPTGRESALRALEAIGGRQALDSALKAIADPEPRLATAAIAVTRSFLEGTYGVMVVDRLTATALDRSRSADVRIAAFQALSALDPATLRPLQDALQGDPNPEIARLQPRAYDSALSRSIGLREAIEGRLPDPAQLRRAVAAEAETVAAGDLHRLIEKIRGNEASEEPPARDEWRATRGAVHAMLAHRGSRLALYDLRESLGSAREPLPVEFLSAVTEIGDASCLEPLAEAYARFSQTRPAADWWQRHLSDAFRAIVTRNRITRRHAAMKRIEKRWPAILLAG